MYCGGQLAAFGGEGEAGALALSLAGTGHVMRPIISFDWDLILPHLSYAPFYR